MNGADISRIDYRIRWATDPEAEALAEEIAEELSRPSDEGDPYGWCASLAEDRERRWSA